MNEDNDKHRSLLSEEDRDWDVSSNVSVTTTTTTNASSARRRGSSSILDRMRAALGTADAKTTAPSSQAYASLAPTTTTQRSASEIARLKADALRRQRENNATFMSNMKKEEDRILESIKARKRQEELDAEYARQLQNCEERVAVSWGADPAALRNRIETFGVGKAGGVRVRCPAGRNPGDCVTIRVPSVGLVATRVPEGVRPGEFFVFHYDPADSIGIKFTVPSGLGRARKIKLSAPNTGEAFFVTVPPDVASGTSLVVRLMKRRRTPAPAPPVAVSSGSSSSNSAIDPEFLAALPPDIRSELMRNQAAVERQVRAMGGMTKTSEATKAAETAEDVDSEAEEEAEEEEEGKEEEDLIPLNDAPAPVVTVGDDDDDDDGDDLFSGMSVRRQISDDVATLSLGGDDDDDDHDDGSSANPLERLRMAKKMFDEGLISDDDFASLKREIMEAVSKGVAS